MFAAREGNKETLSLLINARAHTGINLRDIDWTHGPQVRFDIVSLTCSHAHGYHGYLCVQNGGTAAVYAVKNGHIDCLALLLAAKSNVDECFVSLRSR
jgi:ankyrin repeat protein